MKRTFFLKKTECTEYYAKSKDFLSQCVAKFKPMHSNITKEERKTLQYLRRDDCQMLLTEDKVVIMDKDMYIEKYMALLNNEKVYRECRHQTKSIHSKVAKQLL